MIRTSQHLPVSERLRRKMLFVAISAICAGSPGSVAAFVLDTDNEDLSIHFDNTVRYNLGYRIESQEKAILKNPNADDGDRNFDDHSIVTNRLDLLTEFDVVYKRKYGVRVSAASWYDQAYKGSFDNTSLATSNHLNNGAPAFGLGNYADRYYNGVSGEWLDAFVFGTFDLGSMPLSVRAGRHTVNWGEGLLFGGAIHGVTYAQAPLDAGKAFSMPGVEAKELYRPLAQLSGTLQATQDLSFAAQYFFRWEATRLPEGGTYLGFNDPLQLGGESLIAGVNPATGGLVRALRTSDNEPENTGEWGVSARWSPEWLDGTMGFYVRRFSDKLPQLVIDARTPAALKYRLDYADGINLYGMSLTKQIGGVSVGMDLNYRRDMPLVSETVTVLPGQALPGQGEIFGARGNTVHGVLNALGSLSNFALWDSAIWMAELTWNRWLSVEQGEKYFKGRRGYNAIDEVSRNAFGLALNFTPTWYQVFPGGDLSMPLSVSTGLSGNSAVQFGGNEDAGSYSVGLALDLYQKYRFDLKYVDAFGDLTTGPNGAATVNNGPYALLRDRGAAYFTFKTTF